jgi:hypothetical protein
MVLRGSTLGLRNIVGPQSVVVSGETENPGEDFSVEVTATIFLLLLTG